MAKKSLRRTLSEFIDPSIKTYNKFADVMYGLTGIALTKYDDQATTYLEKGYSYNPTVYSVIKAKADKVRAIPANIKKIEDKAALSKAYQIKNFSIPQLNIKRKILMNKAVSKDFLDFPLKKPNASQSWGDIKSLYEVFMNTCGEFYMYKLKGDLSNEPLQVYVLPADKMQIVLKPKPDLLGMETPIDYYVMMEGNQSIKFECDEIIHVKIANPNFDLQGGHLYGLSPLKAALRNIQSSNEAIDNNNRTLLNSGAFGFITGKGTPLTSEQGQGMKDRLNEMRNDKSALGQISGATAELAFTRISLTTDELKPFDFLKFDEKQICNVLGWDSKLLNDNDGAKYDNFEAAERRVLMNSIMPSLKMWDDMMNEEFLPLFKGYENTVYSHDYSELPEMQIDMAEMVKWLSVARADGAINLNEYRSALNYPLSDDPNMNVHTVKDDIIPLAEALLQDFNTEGNDDNSL